MPKKPPYPWLTATHCRSGHDLKNNLTYHQKNGHGCKECNRLRERERYRLRGGKLKPQPKVYSKLEKEVGGATVLTSYMLELAKKIEVAMPFEKPELERQYAELMEKVR